MSLDVHACAACGHRSYPEPLLCRRCGGASFSRVAIAEGMLEEATVVAPDEGAAEAITIASVRLDDGPTVVARLAGSTARGTRLRVDRRPEGGVAASPIDAR